MPAGRSLRGYIGKLSGMPRPVLDLGLVSIASIVGIILSAATNFLAPIYMSQNDYGIWRVFLLYSGFGGLLHLGLVDGILILWAGSARDKHASDSHSLFAFFLLMEISIGLVLTVAILSISPDASSRWTWIAILILSLTANFLYFFQYILQAFKEFRHLVFSNLTYQICLFLGVFILGLLKVLNSTTAVALSVISLASGVIMAAWPSRGMISLRQAHLGRMWEIGPQMIRVGFVFFAGTVLMAIFFNADNLVVSQSYQPGQYALYAFPAAIVGIIYVLVGAMTTVSFPYLSARSGNSLNSAYSSLRAITIVAWGIALIGYFFIALIMDVALPAYAPALTLLKIMLITVGFGSLIRSVHYNYYRLGLKRSSYMLTNAVSLLLYAILLLGVIRSGSSLETVAWCALLCTGIWFALNEWQLRQFIRVGMRHGFVRPMLGLSAFAVGFWVVSGWNAPVIWQVVAYSLWALFVIRIIFARDVQLIWMQLKRPTLASRDMWHEQEI